MSFKILGTGSFVPQNIVTNDDLSKFLDTSDEWISERTGIRRRHICTTETAIDLAVGAAKNALQNAKISAADLDLILCATISPEYATPSLGCMVQKEIGAACPAMDINSACSGFLFALDVAAGFFARKAAKKVLVIGAERLSRIIDWKDRSTCVIFGDGAGAAVLGEGENYLASKLFTKGDNEVLFAPVREGNCPYSQIEGGHPFVHMNGQETFRFAVQTIVRDVNEILEKTQTAPEQIDWVIPHQANLRIIEAAAKRLNIPRERFCTNIEQYGNTSAASIPILLDEIHRAGKIKHGDLLLFTAFGGGLSSATSLIRY